MTDDPKLEEWVVLRVKSSPLNALMLAALALPEDTLGKRRVLQEIAATRTALEAERAARIKAEAERDALAAQVARLEVEIEAAKLFGVGFYQTTPGIQDVHRDMARAAIRGDTP